MQIRKASTMLAFLRARTNPSRTSSACLLLRCDRVLGGFRDAELHNGLRLDLNRFAGLRVASHAGFAVRFHQAAQSGHYEYAVLLGLFDRRVSEVFQERCSGLVVGAEFLGQMTGELSFGYTTSHEFLLQEKLVNAGFDRILTHVAVEN